MRSRARGISLSLLALFLVARASHACASPRRGAQPSGAASAAAKTPDEPGRYSESGYDVQVTVETEEVPEPKATNPPSASPASKGHPPQLSDAELVRRYRALGLPEGQLNRFLRSRMTLTAWYNWEHIGGKGLKEAGTFLVAFGAVSLLGAAILTGVIWGKVCPRQNCDDDGSLALITAFIGIPAAVAGTIELGVGIPLLVVGNRRLRRWLSNGELETVPIEDLERQRDEPGAKPKTTVTVLPYLTRGGGGVSLALRF